MIYRNYGQTNLKVSALGFGGMRFKDQKDVDGCAALVKAAYDGGINYFDTAIGYGESETVMGVALHEMLKTRSARPFYVSSKTIGGTEDEVRRDLDKSLKRLQLDSLDFYHVWCLLSPQAWADRKAKGVLKAFEKMKDEGLVRHIVASTHMAGPDIAALLRDYPFEGVLLGYSAMNFAFREAGVQAAHELGRAVVAMNPLGGGIIPQNPDRFAFLKTQPDETVVDGALRFLLNDPRITVALVGFSSIEEVQQALRAVEGFQALDVAAVTRIRAELKSSFNELCTGCRYCDHCPQDIPVPKMLDAYNQYVLTGRPRAMAERLAWHWGVAWDKHGLDRCTACGACEKECTQKLPIIARLKEIRLEVENAYAEQQKK
ncbi:MAG: aldo/keto reductase [bacterium]